MLLTIVVHFIGMALLVGLIGSDLIDFFRSPKRNDDGPPPPEPDPVAPVPTGGGGLPLPDAEAAPVRLREPGRIAEHYPRRPRRPEHAPEPQRAPERV